MRAVNVLIDRLTHKDWSPEDVRAMVGEARSGWLVHAAREDHRANAASGGATSAVLIHALERGAIDGALVCDSEIRDGRVRAIFRIARTAEEVLAAQGSKYVQTRFLAEALPQIRAFDGKIAVCGLPCDISNLRRWAEKEPAIAQKVQFTIAFLCGHNSREALIDGVTEKLRKEAGGARLTDFRFRRGRWRGRLSARFDNGAELDKPFQYFSDYRNLHFFSERKCMACKDHFGYDADLSIGDVWLFSLKDDKIKKSGVLVRTDAGQAALERAIEAGAVVARDVGVTAILDGQKRIAPTHYNVAARRSAGKTLGVKLNAEPHRVTPHGWLSAWIGLANMKWSESAKAGWIFRIPRPLLRGALFFKKGLESIK